MFRAVLYLALSMCFWAAISTMLYGVLFVVGLHINFWMVYSFVLIGTIFYYRLKQPLACPIR